MIFPILTHTSTMTTHKGVCASGIRFTCIRIIPAHLLLSYFPLLLIIIYDSTVFYFHYYFKITTTSSLK